MKKNRKFPPLFPTIIYCKKCSILCFIYEHIYKYLEKVRYKRIARKICINIYKMSGYFVVKSGEMW